MSTAIKYYPALLAGDEISQIHDALTASGHHDLASLLERKSSRTPRDRLYSQSLPSFDENDFDVDDDPIVSETDNGAYVMTWRWVAKEDLIKESK